MSFVDSSFFKKKKKNKKKGRKREKPVIASPLHSAIMLRAMSRLALTSKPSSRNRFSSIDVDARNPHFG